MLLRWLNKFKVSDLVVHEGAASGCRTEHLYVACAREAPILIYSQALVRSLS